jgi:hypothetical protein
MFDQIHEENEDFKVELADFTKKNGELEYEEQSRTQVVVEMRKTKEVETERNLKAL